MLRIVPVDRVGLLILRAWTEGESGTPLRAVLRLTTDISSGLQDSLTLTDVDDVCDAVRVWLTELLDRGAGRP